MAAMGFKDEEIKPFCDVQHWLEYFPPKAKSDLIKMGLKVCTNLPSLFQA